MPDMINQQKGIDLMNNNSIINRILFAVTIFHHSPLTIRVFFGHSSIQHHQERERERETTSTSSGTLTGISINHQKKFSSSLTWSWSSIIIFISMRLK
jgi:hypothetical protein